MFDSITKQSSGHLTLFYLYTKKMTLPNNICPICFSSKPVFFQPFFSVLSGSFWGLVNLVHRNPHHPHLLFVRHEIAHDAVDRIWARRAEPADGKPQVSSIPGSCQPWLPFIVGYTNHISYIYIQYIYIDIYTIYIYNMYIYTIYNNIYIYTIYIYIQIRLYTVVWVTSTTNLAVNPYLSLQKNTCSPVLSFEIPKRFLVTSSYIILHPICSSQNHYPNPIPQPPGDLPWDWNLGPLAVLGPALLETLKHESLGDHDLHGDATFTRSYQQNPANSSSVDVPLGVSTPWGRCLMCPRHP